MKDPRRIKTICQLLCCYWEENNQNTLMEVLQDVCETAYGEILVELSDDEYMEKELRKRLMEGK